MHGFRVFITLNESVSLSPSGPGARDSRSIVEHQVRELSQALRERGLGSATVEWIAGLKTQPNTECHWPRFVTSGPTVAIITVETDPVESERYSPPAAWWVQLIADRIEQECQLATQPFVARVGYLDPFRIEDSFSALMPMTIGDAHLTREHDLIAVERAGTRQVFEFYFDALAAADSHALWLKANSECEVYAVDSGFLIVESGRRFYLAHTHDVGEVLRFAAMCAGFAGHLGPNR